MGSHSMRNSNQIFHGDQTRWGDNFYTVDHDPAPAKNFCDTLTRDLFAIASDVNKDWTCKDKDKDFTYSYLLQVAAKPTIAIKQQQWRQSESPQHMTVKPIILNK